MGYIAFVQGTGLTVEIDADGKPHLVKSVIKCAVCGDDRVLTTSAKGLCYKCQEIVNK
jgi:hypothetical protein